MLTWRLTLLLKLVLNNRVRRDFYLTWIVSTRNAIRLKFRAVRCSDFRYITISIFTECIERRANLFSVNPSLFLSTPSHPHLPTPSTIQVWWTSSPGMRRAWSRPLPMSPPPLSVAGWRDTSQLPGALEAASYGQGSLNWAISTPPTVVLCYTSYGLTMVWAERKGFNPAEKKTSIFSVGYDKKHGRFSH